MNKKGRDRDREMIEREVCGDLFYILFPILINLQLTSPPFKQFILIKQFMKLSLICFVSILT